MIKFIFPVSAFLVAASVLMFNSNCTPQLDPPSPQAGSCDFARTVAIGGDFLSGYMDGSLTAEGQDHSVPTLVSRQTESVGGEKCLGYHILQDGGLGWNLKPWESWYTIDAHLGYKTDCLGVNSLMPLSDSLSRTNALSIINLQYPARHNNYAIPFATTPQLFDPTLGNYSPANNTNPYYGRMSTNRGVSSAIDDVVNQDPTFFMAWLGMEDIFDYAQVGGAGASITAGGTFSTYLDSALSRLTVNGAKGVIANIPDFRSFPFYTLVPWNGAALTQSKADSLNLIYQTAGLTDINFVAGNNGFVIEDANAVGGYRQMHEGEYILLDVPLDSMKCDFYGILVNPMNNRYVLDSSEVATIDAAIASYNSIIAQKATQYDLALVDMHSYFAHLQTGLKWDGVDFNAEFVTGGFLSLDGYHPNQKGYALIANEFISAINAKYGSTIPTLNCFDCNGIIFP